MFDFARGGNRDAWPPGGYRLNCGRVEYRRKLGCDEVAWTEETLVSDRQWAGVRRALLNRHDFEGPIPRHTSASESPGPGRVRGPRLNPTEATMGLQISTRKSAGVTIVDLEGKATLGADNDLLDSGLRRLAAGGDRNLLLNLADLTQVDNSGIGTIAATFASVSRHGGTLKLLRPRGRVRTALDVLKWFDYIQTFEDEAEALDSFQSNTRSAAT